MNLSRTIALFLVALAVYWSFKSLMPSYKTGQEVATASFSVDRALEHVKNISAEPHAVGFIGHERTAAYIIGELNKMGLQTSIQEGYTAGDWGNLSKATNIIAKIKGKESGKSLVLISHYDSSPHSSFGASDAGSGVATILEGVSAFLAQNKTPKNDIIILITDSEELGLNGADLFVKKHPLAKNIGLVLNFEARGSGGPSYMLIETNRGNSKLIEEFVKANPDYPVANSLAYSIYKMLPNDTDLTVFREDGDIEGFNFAFIDDHFDYHTALDTYERLDRKTLAHQGSYLMPLLDHFSENSLDNLKSLNDHVYFNIPFFKLVSYPFEWIWPMFGLAVLLFIILVGVGLKKKALDLKSLGKGFAPLLLVLLINSTFGWFSWSALKWWYPGYKDMLHGFTYNGHSYILAFALFALSVCFFVYNRFRKVSTPNLLVAPIFLWLVICGLVSVYLQGASFFVVPLFGLLAAFLVTINQEKPSSFLLLFLALPAIFMYAPFIKMFPVGLGLKMMVASTVFVTLLYFYLLPLFGLSKHKMRFGIITILFYVVVSISAHINSDFSDERPKPSSLLYVYDADAKKANWATYDNVLIGWNSQYLVETENSTQDDSTNKTISSKYSTGFTYTSDAPTKPLPEPETIITRDTIVNENRMISLCITPKRNVNRLEVFTNDININKATVNGIELSDFYLQNRRNGKLITHYISNNDYTEIELELAKDKKLELTLYEAANDLLTNNQFSVPKRPKNSIPMPFVLNDATLIIKKLTFE
ncbi:M28 family peptidase [Croceitalea rosinachiae]|uniref:Vacuolar membrane protease n=1 Tax=Croceitalea rosinachiae TaxID=3075596 RepID=A0ABU3A6W7_9FLAO|nr:M28 family peptidase [Croceitalea sp. F388]MDT0605916.1 M28 family peptidase [Croceitalea sp. F388]